MTERQTRQYASVNEAYRALRRDMVSIDKENPEHEVCAGCGKVATGNVRLNAKRYCDGEFYRPTCFELALEDTAPPGGPWEEL